MIIQVDSKFIGAVNDLCAELQKTGLPVSFISAIIKSTTAPAKTDAVERPKDRFPKPGDVNEKFSVKQLQDSVLGLANGVGATISATQAQAIAVQLNFLLELRRHYGTRKLGRVDKITRAAHRRSIVTGDEGLVKSALVIQVTNLLSAQ